MKKSKVRRLRIKILSSSIETLKGFLGSDYLPAYYAKWMHEKSRHNFVGIIDDKIMGFISICFQLRNNEGTRNMIYKTIQFFSYSLENVLFSVIETRANHAINHIF